MARRRQEEPLAIVGFALEFPAGAISEERLWEIMVGKECCTQAFPEDRFNQSGFYHPNSNRQEAIPVRGASFVHGDIKAFDASFFSITPAEAAAMDPQQRRMLETTYHAFENAGLTLTDVSGSKTSVHIGTFTNDYKDLSSMDPETMSPYGATGMESSIVAGRISWYFNLKGPSLSIDTACSSSLVALDMACKGLRDSSADMAVVGGCSLIFSPNNFIRLSNMGFLSPDGRCFSFDDRANGYARGEGFGVIILKRVSDAVKDGDVIRGIIRSTGVNQDGYTASITQPSAESQQRLILETYQKENLDMAKTRYVEAHGTGTAVGDPIEAKAIAAAFKAGNIKDLLYVGSVKANIGHLEGASGIAGVLKTVLILERAVIPPNAGLERLNPNINSSELNLRFPQTSTPWPGDGLRRASVNSFGIGGTNAHIVLDDACHYLESQGLVAQHRSVRATLPKIPVDQDTGAHSLPYQIDANANLQTTQPSLLVWSAADKNGLKRHEAAYTSYFSSLHSDAEYTMKNIEYTLNERKTLLPWRSFLVASGSDTILKQPLVLSPPTRAQNQTNCAWIFTGQGAQWPAMGKELFAYPVFKNSFLRTSQHLENIGCKWNIIDELLKGSATTQIYEPEFSQPICTAIQLALVDLLRYIGNSPSIVIGHSSGEIASAYSIGAFSHETAVEIAYFRGIYAKKLQKIKKLSGSMMSIGLSQFELQKYFDELRSMGSDDIEIACFNSPRNVTVSGISEHINVLQNLLIRDRVFQRKLHVNIAYHSRFMKDVANDYVESIKNVASGKNTSASSVMISSVTAEVISEEELRDPGYWVRNLVQPVKFVHALNSLVDISRAGTKNDRTVDTLLEIGPHAALQGPIRDTFQENKCSDIFNYDSLLRRGTSAATSFLATVGRLFCSGYPVNLVNANKYESGEACQPPRLVDLPKYPFNHDSTFWHESRISRGLRFRSKGKNDILGTPSPDWNPLTPKWRNFLSSKTLPWLEDHKIDGITIYPAAGMIVMAIEALWQLVKLPKEEPVSFQLRNVFFQAALNIPDDSEGVETSLQMSWQQQTSTKRSVSYDFALYSYSRGEAICHCSGIIGLDKDTTKTDTGIQETYLKHNYQRQFDAAIEECTKKSEKETFYATLNESGYTYGPAFQALDDFSWNAEDLSKAAVSLELPSDFIENDQDHANFIHPTALDSLLQLVLHTVSRGGHQQFALMVPTRISTICITKRWSQSVAGSRNIAVAKLEKKGYRGIDSSLIFSSPGDLLVDMKGYELTSVIRQQKLDASRSSFQSCFYLKWEPDVNLIDRDQLAKLCGITQPLELDAVAFYTELDILICGFMQRILKFETEQKLEELPKKHFRIYLEWMRAQYANIGTPNLPHTKAEWKSYVEYDSYFNELCDRMAKANAEGNYYVAIGRALPQIFSGQVDHLELVFSGSLLSDFYQHINSRSCYRLLEKYIDLLAHKCGSLNILEVGAGTGATTRLVLDALRNKRTDSQGPVYSRYDYTDISPTLINQAKKEMEKEENMRFALLDIEIPVATQGFVEGTYDLIIAANVIHATKDPSAALRHVRTLLKSGGKLILIELTGTKLIRTGFGLGIMSGWWQDYSKSRSPARSFTEWNNLLSSNGFTGADIRLPDYEHTICQETSVIIAEAVEPSPRVDENSGTLIILDPKSRKQEQLAHALRHQILSKGETKVEIVPIERTSLFLGPSWQERVFILEVESEFLDRLTREQFSQLQTLTTHPGKCLWVSSSALEESFSIGLAEGLWHTLEIENRYCSYTTLALCGETLVPEVCAEAIHSVLKSTPIPNKEIGYESSFGYSNGLLYICRAEISDQMSTALAQRASLTTDKLQKFSAPQPLQLKIKTPGLLNTLYFGEDSSLRSNIPKGHVDVEVKAIGINFKDCLLALGQLNEDQLGTECAGTVIQAGLSSGFTVGDRVCVLSSYTCKNIVRADHRHLVRLPQELSFAEGAALPTTFATAWYALCELGRLKAGESVLIHAGAGGVGQAAIQIAQQLQAIIFVTVGSDEKRQLLLDRYNISKDHIFSSRNTLFEQDIDYITRGRGVDVVLNSLSGDFLNASWRCIAAYGRFIEIGKTDICSHKSLPMGPFERSATFSALDLAAIIRDHPTQIQSMLNKMASWITTKNFRPAYPLNQFPIDQFENVFRTLQSGTMAGKFVLTASEDSSVSAKMINQPQYSFPPNRTYIVAGAFGGNGRAIVAWLASRQAKNLILLSRSGPQSHNAQTLCESLREQGITVETPKCDISSYSGLKNTLDDLLKRMPPVAGCIQAAMVVEDAVFENVTYSSWKSCLDPKVTGTRNLHALLPKDLDFFIMLSSLNGVTGFGGLSSYGAANTLQDQIAHTRIANGEKTVTINLGPMVDDGVLAEDQDLFNRFINRGNYRPITRLQLQGLLDYFCDPKLPILSHHECQIGIGLAIPFDSTWKSAIPWFEKSVFRHFHRGGSSQHVETERGDSKKGYSELSHQFSTASSDDTATDIATQALKTRLGQFLSKPLEDVDASQPLYILGVDSLLAIELRNWIKTVFRTDTSTLDILGGHSIVSLAETLSRNRSSL